jgi:hypothetical protein
MTEPATARAVPAAGLAARCAALFPDRPVRSEPRPEAALARALTLGEPAVVAGSLYLVGEIRPILAWPASDRGTPRPARERA